MFLTIYFSIFMLFNSITLPFQDESDKQLAFFIEVKENKELVSEIVLSIDLLRNMLGKDGTITVNEMKITNDIVEKILKTNEELLIEDTKTKSEITISIRKIESEKYKPKKNYKYIKMETIENGEKTYTMRLPISFFEALKDLGIMNFNINEIDQNTSGWYYLYINDKKDSSEVYLYLE